MGSTAVEIAAKQKARFEERRADPKDVYGIPYGLPKLDHMTGGIQVRRRVGEKQTAGENELALLVADSNTGKSSLAGQIARSVAQWFKDNRPEREVRIVTLEMSPEAFQDRMASSLSGVPLYRIQTGMFLDEFQARKYHESVDRLGNLPIRYISDTPSMELLMREVAAEIDGKVCGWWVLDHYNIAPGVTTSENQIAAYSKVATQLFQLARKVSPGMVLTQMKREALSRSDKHPTKADILFGNSLVQSADIILGLYRESLYARLPADMQPEVDVADLELLKNRNRGQLGVIELDFFKDRGIWVEKADG